MTVMTGCKVINGSNKHSLPWLLLAARPTFERSRERPVKKEHASWIAIGSGNSMSTADNRPLRKSSFHNEAIDHSCEENYLLSANVRMTFAL